MKCIHPLRCCDLKATMLPAGAIIEITCCLTGRSARRREPSDYVRLPAAMGCEVRLFGHLAARAEG